MGQGLPLLRQCDGGSWAPHTQMVWFATALAKCRGYSKLGVSGGRPWRFLEMVEESQLKNFTSYITGFNHLRDLSDQLDHRLRVCAWCQV